MATPARTPPIVVALDADPAVTAGPAVRWAAHEAARRGARLRIVLPGHGARGGAPPAVRETPAGGCVRPGVDVCVTTAPDPSVHAKLAESADAGLLVVPGPSADADVLVLRAYCPVAVIPGAGARHPHAGTGTRRDPGWTGPVLVGVGPATGPEVLAFAFAEAAGGGTQLLAVRTWGDPLLQLHLPLPGAAERRAASAEHVRDDLSQQLSMCRVAYPEVDVEQLVTEDRSTELLVELAQHTRLAVLGRPARGAVLNAVAESPAAALTRSLPCPVVVVPSSGSAERHWWPSRPVGLADLRS